MEYIFHEKQDGSLCAQHCLNALLQGPYFTAVELAELAIQLDEQERSQIDQLQADKPQCSENMNESGNFSVQVLSKALEIWSLELVPYLRHSPEAEAARIHPENQRAFICNCREHWFTIRRFGDQWFDLNSLSSSPRLISPTYLSIYLAQLQHEGHSIFVVYGQLPESEADHMISICPVVTSVAKEAYTPKLPGFSSKVGTYESEEASSLQLALDMSATHEDSSPGLQALLQQVLHASRVEEDERQLKTALQLSSQVYNQSPHEKQAIEESSSTLLQEAIQLSLTSVSPDNPPTTSHSVVTAEEIRRKRQAFLDKLEGLHSNKQKSHSDSSKIL